MSILSVNLMMKRQHSCYQPIVIIWYLHIISTLLTNTDCLECSPTSAASKLRELCLRNNSTRAVILPGVHDALSAKIFAQSGADALFLSGFGVSSSRLGQPDAGLLTWSEMEDTAKNVISSVRPIPVVVDGDTGYGGTINMRRTIRGLAALGAAAVTIEDQIFPKRCTYAAGSGVRVVSTEASVRRVKAALASRDEAKQLDGNDILVIARTDCRAACGFDEAITRCKLFEEAGADIVYAENLKSKEEYLFLRQQLKQSTPMILAQVQINSSSNASMFSANEIGNMGYNFGLFGISSLQATIHAVQRSAALMLHDSNNPGLIDTSSLPLTPFEEVKDVIGFNEIERFESKFGHE